MVFDALAMFKWSKPKHGVSIRPQTDPEVEKAVPGSTDEEMKEVEARASYTDNEVDTSSDARPTGDVSEFGHCGTGKKVG